MLCLCHSDSIHDMYSILKYHCLRQQQLKQEVYGQPQLACNRVIYSLYNVVPIINDPSDHYQNHPFGDPDSDHPKQTNVPSTNRIMMFQDLHTCDIHYITSHTYICVRYIQIHSISRYIHSILQIYRDIYRYIHYYIYYTNTQYYPLVNIKKLWKITIFNGKIHYFNGHFQQLLVDIYTYYIYIPSKFVGLSGATRIQDSSPCNGEPVGSMYVIICVYLNIQSFYFITYYIILYYTKLYYIS